MHAVGDADAAVDLTSRPTRAAANGLYTQMGFAVRDTNVYRFTASTSPDAT